MHKVIAACGFSVIASLGLGGCGFGNSKGVDIAKEFGSLSAQFNANTEKLANEIYNSCVRRIAYQQAWSARGAENVQLAFDECNTLNRQASANAIKANQVAVDYIQSIGALAQDDVVDFSGELAEVESALTNFSIPQDNGDPIRLPASAVRIGSQIANFLFGWVAKQKREGALSQAIICSKEPFEKYSNGLKEVYTLGYIDGILKAEYDRMRDYYATYQARARDTGEGLMVLRQLEQDAYNSTLSLNALQDAARGYLKIIDTTLKSHNQLAAMFQGGSSGPSKSTCAQYFGTSVSSSTTPVPDSLLKNSFSELSPSQKVRVSNILFQYHNSIAPIIDDMTQLLNTPRPTIHQLPNNGLPHQPLSYKYMN